MPLRSLGSAGSAASGSVGEAPVRATWAAVWQAATTRVSSRLRGTGGGATGEWRGVDAPYVGRAPHQTEIVRRVHLLIRRRGPPSMSPLGRNCPRFYPVAFRIRDPALYVLRLVDAAADT